MEESKKKPIMLGIVVALLVLASVMAYTNRSKRGASGTKAVWVKCGSPDCEAEYQMDKKEYTKFVSEHAEPDTISVTPPMVCKECEEESAFRSVKCEKCGLIFFWRTVPKDYADRCPGCGHSEKEEEWERTRGDE